MIYDPVLSWAAGFFEGEGSVCVRRPSKRNWGTLAALVANTEPKYLELFRSRWGGSIHALRPSGSNSKAAFRWTISAKQAAKFLSDIQPHVIGERMRVRIFLAIAFQENKRNTRHIPKSDLEDYWVENVWYWRQFIHLNHRGLGSPKSKNRLFR